jgi:hypothetical protein
MSMQNLFKRKATSVIKERFYVKVHYTDRDRAKELGAKWDYEKKQYYVEDDEDEFYDKLKGYKKIDNIHNNNVGTTIEKK